MYARLVRFTFGPGKRDAAEAMAHEIAPLIASQPGCQSVTVFGDDTDGECGIFVLWDNSEHANTAAAIVRPKLDEHLAGKVLGPPDTRLFAVFPT
ncbi:MAG TPA: antibiotic biosynthesis monooxygenase [Acidimicrobiia bacterium]|nr:antibiotic biosynthesis monooxygenase [Acidimicrobiia bacterium]